MHLRYMRAWLRLNVPHYNQAWEDQEVMDCFFLLPQPELPYAAWEIFLSGDTQEQHQENSLDPVERLKHHNSDLFKAGIVRLGA